MAGLDAEAQPGTAGGGAVEMIDLRVVIGLTLYIAGRVLISASYKPDKNPPEEPWVPGAPGVPRIPPKETR